MAKKISLNTKLMGIASFFTDVSSEMIFPLLPFFLTNILAAPAFVIGLMEALGEFTKSLVSFISGLYSDRIGARKKLIISGYSLSALFKVFLVFITSWPQAIAIRVIERAGKGIRDVPRDALIGLSEGKTNLGFAYGFRKLMDNMGAILGPLLATILIAFLFENTTSEEAYRTIFAIAIIPATLAVIGLIFLKDRYTEKTPVRKILREVFQVQEFKQFLIAGFVFSLGHFSIMFFLLRANDFIPLVLIPVSYLAFNVFYTMFSIPAGILSDRIGPRITIILGMFLFLFVLCAFAFFPSISIIFLAFAVLGFFMAIIEEAPKIFMVRSVQENYFASAIGSYKGLVGISALPANLIAGLLYSITILETPATFIFAIITTIAGIILMLTLVKE